jgi:hypothetical protein
MKYNIVNNFNVPEPMSVILTDFIVKGLEKPMMSVSTLSSKPIQCIVLAEKYKEEIQYEIRDFFDAWRGTAIHEYLKLYDKIVGNVVDVEYSFVLNNFLITGTPDSFNPMTKELIDYKYTRKKQGSNFGSYVSQLNYYEIAMLLNGLDVERKTLKVLRSNASRCESTPVIYDVDVPLCDIRKTIRELKDKVTDLMRAMELTPEELAKEYPCSNDDMWVDVEFKVKPGPSQKAYNGGVFKVGDFPSPEEAESAANNFMEVKGEGCVFRVVGEPKRCDCSWCPGHMFCVQHQEYLKNKNSNK